MLAAAFGSALSIRMVEPPSETATDTSAEAPVPAAKAASAKPITRSDLLARRRIRQAASLCVLIGLAALGFATVAELRFGLVPCALCLIERWPYRAMVALGVVGVALPRSFGRPAVALCLAAALAAAGLAALHVGVEQGWWRSPLPECAAPRLPMGGSIAERLAAMPAQPAKPCDDPTYVIPAIPISLAAMNLIYALAATAAIGGALRLARRRRA